MKNKFTYDKKGFIKAKEWFERIKDEYAYKRLDGYSLVNYANDKYQRLNK